MNMIFRILVWLTITYNSCIVAQEQTQTDIRSLMKLNKVALVRAKVARIEQYADHTVTILHIDHIYTGIRALLGETFSVDVRQPDREIRGLIFSPALKADEVGIWALESIQGEWVPVQQIPHATISWPARNIDQYSYHEAVIVANEIERLTSSTRDGALQIVENDIANPSPKLSAWAVNVVADVFPDRIQLVERLLEQGQLSVDASVAADKAVANLDPSWRASPKRLTLFTRLARRKLTNDEAITLLNRLENTTRQGDLKENSCVDLISALLDSSNTTTELDHSLIWTAARLSLSSGPDNPAFAFLIKQFKTSDREHIKIDAANALAKLAAKDSRAKSLVLELQHEMENERAGELLKSALKNQSAD